MSRFSNLELGGEENQPPPLPASTAATPASTLATSIAEHHAAFGAKDETHYLTVANKLFQDARFEEALRAYAKVLEHNPQNTTAWTNQVRMLIELGEYREARLWADKALERFPHDPELLAAKAVALARTADLKAALAFSDAAIEERGDTPYVWLARGDVLLARREKRADYCFEKALSLAPGDWFIAWLASRIQAFYTRFALALRHAQAAISLAPARACVWQQLGQCQLALGLVAPAFNSFEQAQQLAPDLPGLRQNLERASRIGPIRRLWLRLRS
ncbi:tetratricopeptide repeat protein [Geminisphaera colitermitum]|uniref:tetratricopeptide repeat protein n=1 Tax=Geminisphaera colitermitum TaxID=1148786 RepID=UPI0006949FC0|nr:tetratricopeptide repeat protein [Geminisphaera colitermitum]